MTGSGPSLAGTGALVRLALRRDRLRLPLWIAVAAGLVATQSVSSQALYDSPRDLAAYEASVGSNAATIALAGPPVGLDSVAGAVAFEISAFVVVVTALMAVFTTGRHTRGDEEAGRTELLRATRVGRHAPLVAAVVVASLACLATALAVGGAAAATGLPVGGSFVLGASVGAAGLVFTGVTAVVAQATGSTRATYGGAGLLLGLAFVLRAVGDVLGNGVSWASPIGWAQATHPFSGDRVAPLLLCLGVAGGLLVLAGALLDRRDLGSGLVPPRPGPAAAPGSLGSPLGLALRLHRGALIGWTAALALLGLVHGALAESVETLFADNPEARALLPDAAGLVDAYLATTLSINALLAGAYAVSAVLRARAEESAGRVEPVLATATSRTAFLGSHGAVALAGSSLALAVLGLVNGALAGSVETLFADNPEARALLPDAGGLVDAYLATTLSLDALLAGAYAVSAVLRARAEESAGRAEPVLATATGRTAFLGSHGAVALAGSSLVLGAAGAATAGTRAAATGDAGELGRLLGATLAYLPAVWVLAGAAVVLVGVLPRPAAAVAWGVVAYVSVTTVFAGSLDWPGWVDGLSPLAWTPLVPVDDASPARLAALTVVAGALLAAGLAGFRRRDLAPG